MRDFNAMIDHEFLRAHDVDIQQAFKAPWQFFVTHPDLKSRFAYYPSTGACVYEGESGPCSSYEVADEEELLALIQSKINK